MFKETKGLLLISILSVAPPPPPPAAPPWSSAGLVVGPWRRAGRRRGPTQRRRRWQRSRWAGGCGTQAGVGLPGVEREGGAGGGMEGRERRQLGGRRRGQLEEVAVV